MNETIFKTKSLILADIVRKADWVRMDSTDCLSYVLDLEQLPDYETEAEEHVKLALQEVYRVALRMEQARAHMVTKREMAALRKIEGEIKEWTE